MVATAFSSLVSMETEEARIAKGLRGRDPDLLDALVEQYQHRLLRYLSHLTSNQALAEDLFQETWMRVLEKGHQYDGRNKFSSWLFSIAHNVAIDYLRKRQPASLDEINERQESPVLEPADGGPSAFDVVAGQEQAVQIAAAMERVPLVYREVLVLRFQEQMKLEEIAQLIHIPLATVKTRLYRGVMALRPAFQGGAQ